MSGGALATDVRVPATGNAGEDAVVLEWNVTEGSDVTAGQILVTLETAKATIDVEAPISGHVLKTFYAAAPRWENMRSSRCWASQVSSFSPTVPLQVQRRTRMTWERHRLPTPRPQ